MSGTQSDLSLRERLDRLNQNQRLVALEPGNSLAVASPGSGKTGLISVKGPYFLSQGKSVAAVTFTKPAAEELKERMLDIAGPVAKSRLLVGTFHSMCLNMAFPNRNIGGLGAGILGKMRSPYTVPWKIIKDGVKFNYVARAISQSGLDLRVSDALFLIESAKEKGKWDDLNPDEQTLVETYQDLLHRKEEIDMQDLLLLTVKALREGTMSTLPVDQLYVDEYQDTDETQYEWIRHHARAGIAVTCVGDDDQSIYGFRRGMGYEAFERFGREFDANRVLLNVNYRSRAEILAAAQRVILHNDERIDKSLHSEKGEGGFVMFERFDDSASEAAAIAVEAEIAYNDRLSFGIITRTKHEQMEIQAALIAHSVPFRRTDGKNIFDEPEVQVYFALLRTIVPGAKPNKHDVDLILGAIGIGEGDIRIIEGLFNGAVRVGAKDDYANSGISKFGMELWRDFAKNHGKWCAAAQGLPYGDLNDNMGAWLKGAINKALNGRNVEAARQLFAVPDDVTLKDNLARLHALEQRLKLQEKGKKEDKVEDDRPIPDIMTAHGSKGLERDIIWIAGLAHGTFPSERGSLAEERRLMFVAMTRAREVLYLSTTRDKKPSLFLYEAGLIDGEKAAA